VTVTGEPRAGTQPRRAKRCGRTAGAAEVPGIRPVTDDDADGLIALVGACFDEYPGCVLDLRGLDADLLAPATEVSRRGGAWWVVERQRDIVATVGVGEIREDGLVELKRLYVGPSARRQGLAAALVGVVEAHAIARGALAVELWSDTRFLDAHRLYERLGYLATGETRELHDPSDTTERRFRRDLGEATGD
jgi:GNAT superfamily N-acetyltransferase